MVVKVPEKDICLECEHWRRICVLPAVAEILAKIIQECIKEHLKISSGEQISTLLIIANLCMQFR